MTRSAHGLGLQKKRGKVISRSANEGGRRYIYHAPIALLGDARPMFPDAHKCECGASLKTELDKYLHLNGGRECLYQSGQRPRRHILENL